MAPQFLACGGVQSDHAVRLLAIVPLGDHAIPHHDDLRAVFLNPPDVGGRYSALTYVGLVPASLIGLDLDALLASAQTMAGACRQPDPAANPGVSLGLAIGALARAGREGRMMKNLRGNLGDSRLD